MRALLFLFAVLTTLPSCSYCLQQEHKNELKCQAERAAIDCTSQTVLAVVFKILPTVAGALVGSDVDWEAMGRASAVAGTEAIVGCAVKEADRLAVAALQGVQLPKASEASLLVATSPANVHKNAATYRKLRG